MDGPQREPALSYHQAKERYAICRSEAIAACVSALPAVLGVEFTLSGWNAAALSAYQIQWPAPQFDWPVIFERHRDPDRLDLAIWVGERLCGLALAVTASISVNILFLEGDSRDDCPLRGRRALIALDAATNYAQGRGKTELRVELLETRIQELYRDEFGFNLVTTGQNAPYWRKGV